MPLSADRNILFGILALQLDFINRDQLASGMRAWANGKVRAFSDLVAESGALSAECRKLLELLVDEHVRQHGGDAIASIAALPDYFNVQAELSRIADPKIDEVLVAVASARQKADLYETLPPVASNLPQRRFQVLRPHAEGGLGTVSVAQDQELNREVALKEIQPRYADDLSARARFVFEAEVTGGLEHPSIVPVYGLGTYPDGRPYYAMRFIKGDSLREVADRLHTPDKSKRSDAISRMIDLRNLLGRFIDVCQAIEYAHTRGVIHRDLKPENIMLGAFGETLVVDWGLAKSFSNNRTGTLGTERALTPLASQSIEATQMGSTVGTLQYMSPEQAAGRMDLMGPAADIYSLGATLYYILTGQPSVTGSSLTDLIRNVQNGNFLLPSAVVRDVPKALEAICLKAMAREPHLRYASALAMAKDLECWLADEPVSSLPESKSERMARWLRRHRTWFRAVSAAVFSIIMVLTAAIVLINKQRHVAEEQRERAEGLAKEKTELAIREIELRKKAEWQAASRSIENSLTQFQQTDATTGVLSLVQNLEEVSRIGAADLEYSVRAQLGRWEGALHTIESATPYPDSIRTMVQSPDGGRMLVVSDDIATLIDLTNQKSIGQPIKHDDRIFDAIFRRDGELLITGSKDKSVRFWNGHTGEPIGTPLLHDGPVVAIALSHDDRYLATASESKIRLWDVETGEPTDIEFDQEAKLSDIAFSPVAPVLLACDSRGQVKLWNTESKERLGTQWVLGMPAMSIVVSPDGKYAATAEMGNIARLWVVATGETVGSPLVHFGMVTQANFSWDGKKLLTASVDQMARLWDVSTGSMLGPPLRHPSNINSAIFDRNDETVWTGATDQGMRRWRIANGKSVPLALGLNGNVIEANFNKEGTAVRMVIGEIPNVGLEFPSELRRWMVPSGQPLSKPVSLEGCTSIATFTHGSDRFAALTNEGTVGIWNVTTGEPTGPVINPKAEVTVLTFSHDDSLLLVGTKTGQVQLWRVDNGEPARASIQLDERIASAVFFPDDKHFMIGSWDATTRMYPVSDSSEFVPTVLKHESLVSQVGVHPQGSVFFSYSSEGNLRFWDTNTSQQIGKAIKIMPRPRIVKFSPDGRTIFASCVDGATRQWEVRTCGEIGSPVRQSKAISALAQSSNGRWIATASNDFTARLWDIGPANGSYDRVKLKYEAITGTQLQNDGTLDVLSIGEWQSRVNALQVQNSASNP